MHKQHGDHDRKFRDHADADGDWTHPHIIGGRRKIRHPRHKPYEKFSRTSRDDWFEDLGDDSDQD